MSKPTLEIKYDDGARECPDLRPLAVDRRLGALDAVVLRIAVPFDCVIKPPPAVWPIKGLTYEGSESRKT